MAQETGTTAPGEETWLSLHKRPGHSVAGLQGKFCLASSFSRRNLNSLPCPNFYHLFYLFIKSYPLSRLLCSSHCGRWQVRKNSEWDSSYPHGARSLLGETDKQADNYSAVRLQINCQKWHPKVYFLYIKILALIPHLLATSAVLFSATLLIPLFPASLVTSSSPHPVATSLSTICFIS